MLEVLQRTESDDGVAGIAAEPEARGGSRVVFSASLFQIGRAIFGGVLAFMAVDNLQNLEERIGYAEAKGVPAPEWTVPANSVGLLLGGLGLMLWRVPRASATAIATFFLTVTPLMHDFWNVDDEEEKQQEIFDFLKNTALLGAALAFVNLAAQRERE